MTKTNVVYLILIIVAILMTIVLLAVVLQREHRLRSRKKINYYNFSSMYKYFYLKVSKVFIGYFIFSTVYKLILAILIAFNKTTFVYLSILLLLMIIELNCILMYVTSIKYNRNLEDFVVYYRSIKSSFSNKTKIIENIKQIKKSYLQVDEFIEKLYINLNGLLNNFSEIPNIIDCYLPLDNLKAEQENILNSFDNTIINTFTTSLINYLKNGGLINSKSYIFNPGLEIDLPNILDLVSNKIKECYHNFLVTSFLNHKYRDINSLIEILNTLIKNNYFDSKYVDIIINIINNDTSKNSALVAFLFNNQLINIDIINNCIENNNEWIFTNSFNKVVTKSEITQIVETLINENKLKLANKFLLIIDKGSIQSVKKGIKNSKLNNEVVYLLNRYTELIELDGGFNSQSNRYENIALALLNYENDFNIENQRLASLIENELFYENKKYLDTLYNSVLKDIDPILNKTFKSMLNFSIYGNNLFDYFQQSKINYIYVEYKRRLNVMGLFTLSVLLDGIMLQTLNDKALVNNTMQDINNIYKLELTREFYNEIIPQESLKNYGKNLIINLQNKHLNELTTLVNHIEKERLVLDKIKAL